jgi:hypothetical protein
MENICQPLLPDAALKSIALKKRVPLSDLSDNVDNVPTRQSSRTGKTTRDEASRPTTTFSIPSDTLPARKSSRLSSISTDEDISQPATPLSVFSDLDKTGLGNILSDEKSIGISDSFAGLQCHSDLKEAAQSISLAKVLSADAVTVKVEPPPQEKPKSCSSKLTPPKRSMRERIVRVPINVPKKKLTLATHVRKYASTHNIDIGP